MGLWGKFSLITIVLVSSCGYQIQEPESKASLELESYFKEGYFSSKDLWPDPHIDVCWENKSGHAEEKKWVENKIKDTWGKHSRLEFLNWGSCVVRGKSHIRIKIADEGAHTKDLGFKLNQMKSGMVLNFTFKLWNEECNASSDMRKKCIETIAIHEFGHALGMAHEHNREDRPRDCKDGRQGPNVDTMVGEFDRDSIMNYCYDASYSNKLSAGDIHTIQQMYGAP